MPAIFSAGFPEPDPPVLKTWVSVTLNISPTGTTKTSLRTSAHRSFETETGSSLGGRRRVPLLLDTTIFDVAMASTIRGRGTGQRYGTET